MKRWLRWVVVGFVLVAVGIQFVPVDRSNPPVENDIGAPPEVRTVLRRACYDCHSNETVWPVQAYIAPVSWLVARDVKEGRRKLNFSRWGLMSPHRQQRAPERIADKVEEGEMPLPLYVLAHPEAKLSASDRDTLVRWARSLSR